MENEINLNQPLIGVIGGVGPYAGLDFTRKIFANTIASKDQEHLNCILISCPSIIPDRTGYLFQDGNGKTENPAFGMFQCALRVYVAGARYATVACNTAHSEKIFSLFCAMADESLPDLRIINMLETCADYVKESLSINCLGLLATKGTHKSKVYHEYFHDGKINLLEPDEQGQEMVHNAIYCEEYGIKAHSHDIKNKAREILASEINSLIDRGAQAVILGCTELPLAVEPEHFSIPVIDPAMITARKLIQLVAPEKLKHL
jgi:aspartate racemase